MALKHKFHKLAQGRKIVPKRLWDILEDLDQRIDDDAEVNSLATSVASGPGYTQNQLNIAFGDASSELVPESFVGVYTNENDGKKYLVTVSNGEWKGILFNAIS